MDINTLPIEEVVGHLQTQVDRLQVQIIDAEKYVSKFTDSSIKRIEDALADLKQDQIAATEAIHTEQEKASDAATHATQAIQKEAATSQNALHELRLALGSLAIVETQIESFSATLDQMAETMKALAKHFNDHSGEMQNRHAEHREHVKQYVDVRIDALSKSVFEHVSDKILKQVTPEVIAKALAKQILVTRPAHQHELKEGNCLAVRQATLQEIRDGKLN